MNHDVLQLSDQRVIFFQIKYLVTVEFYLTSCERKIADFGKENCTTEIMAYFLKVEGNTKHKRNGKRSLKTNKI